MSEVSLVSLADVSYVVKGVIERHGMNKSLENRLLTFVEFVDDNALAQSMCAFLTVCEGSAVRAAFEAADLMEPLILTYLKFFADFIRLPYDRILYKERQLPRDDPTGEARAHKSNRKRILEEGEADEDDLDNGEGEAARGEDLRIWAKHKPSVYMTLTRANTLSDVLRIHRITQGVIDEQELIEQMDESGVA